MITLRAVAVAGTLLATLTLPLSAAWASADDVSAAPAQDGEPAFCVYVGDPLWEWVCVGVDIGDIGSHA